MKKTLWLCWLICILLAACTGKPQSLPTHTPSPSPSLSPTRSASSTPLSSSTPTAALQPSPTFPLPTDAPFPTKTPFPPYPNKQVVLSYSTVGNFSDVMVFFDHKGDPPSGYTIPKLVLYADGQLIIAQHEPAYGFVEKTLTPAEMKSLLSRIESQGFFTLESNQQHDPSDKLYDFEGHYQRSADGLWDCIHLKASQSRGLCIRPSEKQYLIPAMKNILNILDSFRPAGMLRYVPDRILLSLQVLDPERDYPPSIIPAWDKNMFSLTTEEGFIEIPQRSIRMAFISGELAQKIYRFYVANSPYHVFSQNDVIYSVGVTPLLPDDRVVNPKQ